MRYSALLIFILSMGIELLQAKSVDAQALNNTKIQLNIKQEQLDVIFQQIENKTGFHFVYNNDVVTGAKKVDLVFKGNLAEALTQLEAKTNTVYKQIGKNIVVTRKTAQQQGRISGHVYDGDKVPLAGATVKVVELDRAAITDANGYYQFQLPEGTYTLQASFISFGSQLKDKVKLQDNQAVILDFTLQQATGDLNEVVVVGFGTQKKVNLTGSVSTIKMDNLKNRPITNASQALQGVSGAYINQSGGGQPGRDGVSVLVRGQGTLNSGTAPLVLVDGIEYTLSAINPNDIESISVLKDAASASIYGNRAANGVILVTTKKGAQGAGKIEYNNFFGTQHTTYLPDLVTDPIEFMTLRNRHSATRAAPRLITVMP